MILGMRLPVRLFGHHDKAQWSGASSSRIRAFIAFFATLLLIGTSAGPAAGAGDGKSASTASTAAPTVGAPSMYQALTPARLLDTRTGVGARRAAVAAGATVTVQVTGRGGIPTSGVAAAVLNITATTPTHSGYITAYAAGTARPIAPTLDFTIAQTTRNLTITRVGTTGKIALYNGSTGTVHLIADTCGYYRAGPSSTAGAFTPLTPARLLDTRTGTGTGTAGAAVAPGATITVQVTGRSGIPTSGVAAAVLNITATSPTRSGYITAYTADTARPVTPTLDFATAHTTGNLAITKIGAAGNINLYNGSTGTVNLAADVVGWLPTTTARPAPTTAAGYTAAFAALPVEEWGAGDGGVSVPVGSRDVWLFGDTFEAHENGFAHSTVVVQRGGNFHVSNAGAQLLPNDDDTHIYWMIGATVVDDNSLLVTGRSVVLGGTGMWDFSDGGFDHTALVRLDNYDNATFVEWISKENSPPPDPGPPYDLGTDHFGYQLHSHPEAVLASGNVLMSMSQNWTDGLWHGWTAYQLIFSEQPAS